MFPLPSYAWAPPNDQSAVPAARADRFDYRGRLLASHDCNDFNVKEKNEGLAPSPPPHPDVRFPRNERLTKERWPCTISTCHSIAFEIEYIGFLRVCLQHLPAQGPGVRDQYPSDRVARDTAGPGGGSERVPEAEHVAPSASLHRPHAPIDDGVKADGRRKRRPE
jgi:hypothetical protein